MIRVNRFVYFVASAEFLSVPTSQLFRQVYQGGGSVSVQGRNVTVVSEAQAGVATRIRENYLVSDNDN